MTPSTPGVADSSRAWSRPIRPAPSSATLIVPAPVGRSTRARPSQGRGEHATADRRALRRRPPAAVLLDHQPAVVVAARRATARTPSRSSSARAELGEQARPDRRRRSRRARPLRRRVEHDRVDVLEMDVGHAIAEVAQRRDRVAAADQVVADVEADPDEVAGRVGATRRSTSAGVSMNVPAWGWKADPVPGRDAPPRRWRGRTSTSARPSPRRSGPACPARRPGRPRASRSGDTSSATHRTSPPPSWSSRSRSRPMASASGDRSVDGRRQRQRRPRPGGGRARPARPAARRPRGSRCRAGCPRSRSGRSRRGSSGASVPSRRSARSTLFQRIGTVPIDAPRQGVARPAERRPEVGRRRVPARRVIGAAPRRRRPPIARAARGGIPGSGRPTSRSCRVRRPRGRGRP